VMFTEIGYTTRADPAVRPWEWPDAMKGVHPDERAQAAAYRALIAPLLDEPDFAGFFVWRVYSDPDDVSQEAEWGFSPRGKRAELVVRGKSGNRVVPIDEFLVDSYTTAVAEGEMALEVRFPTPGERTSGSYQKIERKVGDFATAAAGVQLTLDADGTVVAAGIAIGAAGPTAKRVTAGEALLVGARPSQALLREAAAEARTVSDPIADTRGDIEFKREMAAVLVYRGLLATLARLGQGEPA